MHKEITKADFIRIMRESKSDFLCIYVAGAPSESELVERARLAYCGREVAEVRGLKIYFDDYDGPSLLDLSDTKFEKRTCYDHGNGILEVRINATLSDGMPYLKHIYYAVKAKGLTRNQ